MSRKLLKGLELVLMAVLAVSLVMIIRTQMEYSKGASTYEEAAIVAELPKLTAVPAAEKPDGAKEDESAISDPNLALMAEINLDELRRENPDVLGWISIPDTVLSYPLLQGEDNDFYLRRSWQKESCTVGSVFMDFRSDPELTDFNTIIYGHRMRDGSMFACLRYYSDQEYWRTHPSIYLAQEEGVCRYDIFSAYETSVRGPVYDFSDRDTEGRQAFIDSCMKLSVIETNAVPTVDDRLLTLSTCPAVGYSTRWVVQAVLTEFYAR